MVPIADKVERSPKLVHAIPSPRGSVIGIRAMNGEIFVLRPKSHRIEVYEVDSFKLARHIDVNGMSDAQCLATCSYENCLYVSASVQSADSSPQSVEALSFSFTGINQTSAPVRARKTPSPTPVATIYRIAFPMDVITQWSIKEGVKSISVSNAHGVILVCPADSKLREYSSTGDHVHDIILTDADDNDIDDPVYAIQLKDDRFAVSFQSCVGIFTDEGSLVSKYSCIPSVANEPHSTFPQVCFIRELFQCANGCLLVADSSRERILVVNPSLDNSVTLAINGEGEPLKVGSFFLDERCGRLYVGNTINGQVLVLDEVCNPGRVLIYSDILGEPGESHAV